MCEFVYSALTLIILFIYVFRFVLATTVIFIVVFIIVLENIYYFR